MPRSSIAPIVWVGESLADREAGKTLSVVQSQLDRALRDSRRPRRGRSMWLTSLSGQ